MRRPQLLAFAIVLASALLVPTSASAAPSGRIINGWEASSAHQASMWSFLVSIGTTGRSPLAGHFCGGSLIAPTLVLTAAHCVDSWDEDLDDSVRSIPSSLSILAGTRSLRAAGSGQRRRVRDVFVHPRWNAARFDNDLAVLRLDSAIRTTASAAPGQVVAASEDSWWGAGAGMVESIERGPWAAGWGNTRPWERGESYPAVLREVALPLASDEACAAPDYPGLGELDAGIEPGEFLCAGRPDSDDVATNGSDGADTCQGDSGGPLVVGDGAGAWRIFGIVSHGDVCGGPAYGAYTRVATYRSWIASIAATANGPGGIRPVRSARLASRTSTSALVRWNAPIRGAASYVAYADVGDGGTIRYGVTKQRAMRFTDLDPGSAYTVYIAARDRQGNESPWRRVTARTSS